MGLTAGLRVRSIDNPGRLGIITNTPPRQRPSGQQWQVHWDAAGVSFEYEDALEPVDADIYKDPYQLISDGRFGRIDDFRRNLTFVHLTGRLANLVYSMGVTHTDFYPHQYRPLLTLLESPCSGILIADEVGLGKTIEAGLIWTEFRARYDKKRLLIVCPAMLREKWRDELEGRFGVRAQIVSANDLREGALKALSSTHSDAAWVISYPSARPPRSWEPGETSANATPSPRELLANVLHAQAEELPMFDLVIFDEAHNMRNRGTTTWKLGSLLRDVSEFQVMLSATPINLRNDDLFSLLTLLDPDHFTQPDDLAQLIESNRPLVAARDIVLNLKTEVGDYVKALNHAQEDWLLESSAQLQLLKRTIPSPEAYRQTSVRAELAEALERVNLLSHVLTRTRKRDLPGRRIERRVYRERVVMSQAERAFYDAVTMAIRAYAVGNDISSGFLLAMPQRQVSSCPAALLASWLEDDEESEVQDFVEAYGTEDTKPKERGPLRRLLKTQVQPNTSSKALWETDSKYKRLKELISEVFERDPQEKLIIFTTFRGTAKYVAGRLNSDGVSSRIVWGDPKRSKYEVIEEFKSTPDLRVLVSTEVAAEGVDLQFCRMVINYDLPWNPTRVEQRIGRVDRLGQLSDHIFVWNLYFADTIDDRIVSRLLDRLQIFESALGEAEAVVGETVAKLEFDLLCRPRSSAEEADFIDRAALALETVARQRQQLEDNAPHMMAHGQRVLERIQAAQQLSRFVSEKDLFVLVRDCLSRYWPGHEFIADDQEPMRVRLRLSPDLVARFDPFLRDRGAVGQTRLTAGRSLWVLFKNSIAGVRKEEGEVIHQFHPLVAFLTADMKSREEEFFPVVAMRIRAEHVSEKISPGDYAFSLIQWSFSGVFQEEWLTPALVKLGSGVACADDLADSVLHSARLQGRDWIEAQSLVDRAGVAMAMEIADLSIESKFKSTAEKKRAENADRVRFQIDSIERYSHRRRETLASVEAKHKSRGRTNLVKATQGQRRALDERMEYRLAAVNEKASVSCSSRFVCGGVLRIEE